MTRTVLKIANDLSLPLEVVTQTLAILAKRRAGKSYTMRRLAEQLFTAGQQVVLVDPKGDQWGIRSASDGQAPGLPIIILGGERGDVPLEPGSGEIVAKLIVEERVSVLLDLSPFRKHEVATFMTAFLENLYRLKAREIYRTPMMLVIDEADAVAPQKPQKGEERMLGAAEDIVRRGGQRGIGCVLVTQRSAVLNKNVLTQAQILVVLRTIAPQDLAAMKAWIDVHGDVEQGRLLMESLPSLPIGDAWFWSPGWPTTDGIFKRVHVLPIETFDSGASPKPGVKPVEPKHLADVDLDALKGQMAATIEKAKAEDPKLLKAEIARLKRELEKKPTAGADPLTIAAARQEGREEGARDGYAAGLRAVQPIAERLSTLSAAVSETVEGFQDDLRRLAAAHPPVQRQTTVSPSASPSRPAQRVDRPVSPPQPNRRAEVDGVNGPQQRILDAAAFLQDTLGTTTPDVVQLALFAGQSATGGYWRRNIGRLRSLGLIEGTTLTAAGRAAAQPSEIQTVEQLHAHVVTNLLEGAQRPILQALIAAYPQGLDAEELGKRCSLEPEGGYWRRNIGRLRSLGLVSKRGPIAALPVLFLER